MMSDLDRKIREALRKDDAELFEELGDEPNIFEQLFEAFQGRNRWLNLLAAAMTLIFFVLGVSAAVAFFRTDGARDQILWAGSCTLCMIAVAMLKMWYWMELQRNVVLREIKRVELQIARLAARVPGK